jgi:hypothetical protein
MATNQGNCTLLPPIIGEQLKKIVQATAGNKFICKTISVNGSDRYMFGQHSNDLEEEFLIVGPTYSPLIDPASIYNNIFVERYMWDFNTVIIDCRINEKLQAFTAALLMEYRKFAHSEVLL